MFSNRIRKIAFKLKAISDKQRFFDMYATFVMKDVSPEAEAIFQTEFEYFNKMMENYLIRMTKGRLPACFEYAIIDYYEAQDEGWGPEEPAEDTKIIPELQSILKAFLPANIEYGGAFNYFNTLPFSEAHKLYTTNCQGTDPWFDIINQYQGLKRRDFTIFDHVIDLAHGSGSIREDEDFPMQWLTDELLNLKTDAKSLKELAPHTSREVQKLIHRFEQLST
jgi:hypothetical protein